MEKDKISRPDFEKAENEVLKKHNESVRRRIADVAWKSFESAPIQIEATKDKEDATSDEYILPISDFYDREDFSSTEQEVSSATEVISERSKKAQEAMTKLIRDNVRDSGKAFFELKNAEQDEALLLELAIRQSRGLTSRSEITDRIRDSIDAISNQREDLSTRSPEGYLVVHGFDLREHIKQIHDGEIVTTPYVQKNLDRLEKNMVDGRPSFIHGHLGSGKTELAITAATHVAIDKTALSEAEKDFQKFKEENPEASKKECREVFGIAYRRNKTNFEKALKNGDSEATERFKPLIISGSKDLTSEDLYTDKSLKLTKFDGKTLLEHKADLDTEIKAWQDAHPEEASDPAKAKEEADKIIELYKLQNEAFGTEVEIIKKVIYRGVEEGRPVIIDEANAIPAAILISLNDVLQRRPGQSCYIPGAGSIKIKDGFSVTMTGNLGSGSVTYGGTEEMSPAFLSRLDVFEHDYLPMSGNNSEKYNVQANPEKNELFHVMVAYLAERTGDLQLPEMDESLRKLFSLSQLAHETQIIFADKWRESDYLQTASGDEMEPRLEKSVLSIRNVLNVLQKWDKGSEMDLDKALWEGFISGMTNADEQNLVLAFAKRHGFFSESEGWKVEFKELGAGFTTLDDIHPNAFAFERKPMETYDLRKTVEMLYGPGPKREVYPDDINLDELEDLTDDEPTVDDFIEGEAKIKEISDVIKALEVLGEQCGCPKEVAEGA